MPADGRIIFDEFAILCELHDMRNQTASRIAAAQGISCPTMTHRGNHLCELGLMSRTTDEKDHRKLRCALTRKGVSFVNRTCRGIAQAASEESGIGAMETRDVVRLVARVGALPMPADAVVLASFAHTGVEAMTVMQIVDLTGLLQPTVSMAVLRLEEAGLMERREMDVPGQRSVRHASGCVVTPQGKARASELAASIQALEC